MLFLTISRKRRFGTLMSKERLELLKTTSFFGAAKHVVEQLSATAHSVLSGAAQERKVDGSAPTPL
ncbi:hypothetical protein XI03_20675 [Bradyrhizobium sp. CCBAU 65884]|nr:hypothetical protein [Bradyrhizobium sp. CCBAU 65884]